MTITPSNPSPSSAARTLAAHELIEVRVAELKQLFNAIDPSPFRERDLDPEAEAFIVGWARELPGKAPPALLVHLERPAGLPDETATLRAAIGDFFSHRAQASSRRLRQLLRVGRTSFLIGIAFLAAAFGLGHLLSTLLPDHRIGGLLREAVLIGGWVAMWRPLEIFLYDWWPISADIRLFRRLAAMPVEIRYPEALSASNTDGWKRDWPVTKPCTREQT